MVHTNTVESYFALLKGRSLRNLPPNEQIGTFTATFQNSPSDGTIAA